MNSAPMSEYEKVLEMLEPWFCGEKNWTDISPNDLETVMPPDATNRGKILDVMKSVSEDSRIGKGKYQNKTSQATTRRNYMARLLRGTLGEENLIAITIQNESTGYLNTASGRDGRPWESIPAMLESFDDVHTIDRIVTLPHQADDKDRRVAINEYLRGAAIAFLETDNQTHGKYAFDILNKIAEMSGSSLADTLGEVIEWCAHKRKVAQYHDEFDAQMLQAGYAWSEESRRYTRQT